MGFAAFYPPLLKFDHKNYKLHKQRTIKVNVKAVKSWNYYHDPFESETCKETFQSNHNKFTRVVYNAKKIQYT